MATARDYLESSINALASLQDLPDEKLETVVLDLQTIDEDLDGMLDTTHTERKGVI